MYQIQKKMGFVDALHATQSLVKAVKCVRQLIGCNPHWLVDDRPAHDCTAGPLAMALRFPSLASSMSPSLFFVSRTAKHSTPQTGIAFICNARALRIHQESKHGPNTYPPR